MNLATGQWSYIHITPLSISRNLSSSQIGILYPLSKKSSLPILPTSRNHHPTLSLGTVCKGIIQYLSSCGCLVSLRMSSRFLDAVACVRTTRLTPRARCCASFSGPPGGQGGAFSALMFAAASLFCVCAHRWPIQFQAIFLTHDQTSPLTIFLSVSLLKERN